MCDVFDVARRNESIHFVSSFCCCPRQVVVTVERKKIGKEQKRVVSHTGVGDVHVVVPPPSLIRAEGEVEVHYAVDDEVHEALKRRAEVLEDLEEVDLHVEQVQDIGDRHPEPQKHEGYHKPYYQASASSFFKHSISKK